MKDTVGKCCSIIEKIPASRVTEVRRIQEMNVTLAFAVVMAVSHLGLHVGQIQYIGKMLLSEGYVESWKPLETNSK